MVSVLTRPRSLGHFGHGVRFDCAQPSPRSLLTWSPLHQAQPSPDHFGHGVRFDQAQTHPIISDMVSVLTGPLSRVPGYSGTPAPFWRGISCIAAVWATKYGVCVHCAPSGDLYLATICVSKSSGIAGSNLAWVTISEDPGGDFEPVLTVLGSDKFNRNPFSE